MARTSAASAGVDQNCIDVQTVIVQVLQNVLEGLFDPSLLGYDKAASENWQAGGKAPVKDLFGLLEFLGKDGKPDS